MPLRLRAKSRSTKSYKDLYSSWPGFFLTLTGVLILGSYFLYLVIRMYGGLDDKTGMKKLPNDFEFGHDEFMIDNFTFYPTIELQLLSSDSELLDWDIFVDKDALMDEYT